MQGRVEHKKSIEVQLQNKLKEYPEILMRFYYSLNMKSHNTKLRYINNILRFLNDYTNDNIYSLSLEELQNIDAYIIEQYINKISYFQKGSEIHELSNATKACIYSSLNAFFNFLTINNYIIDSPFSNKKIRRPKIQETSITFLTPEEVKLVENAILHGVGNARSKGKQRNWKFRDYLLFRIPVINGIRVTALSEINIEDLHLDNHSITVTEKGNITKDVYIDDQTCMFIELWLKERQALLKDKTCNALFISSVKNRMTIRSIENVIQKYTQATVEKHITPHKLRSTCGTNLYQAKKDIYLVADVLGHKTTAPTRKYAKIFDQDKRNAISTMADIYK